jgi:hypothetical protein
LAAPFSFKHAVVIAICKFKQIKNVYISTFYHGVGCVHEEVLLKLGRGGDCRLVKCGRKLAQELAAWMVEVRRLIGSDVVPSLIPQPRIASVDHLNNDGLLDDASVRRTYRHLHSLAGPQICFTGLPAGNQVHIQSCKALGTQAFFVKTLIRFFGL